MRVFLQFTLPLVMLRWALAEGAHFYLYHFCSVASRKIPQESLDQWFSTCYSHRIRPDRSRMSSRRIALMTEFYWSIISCTVTILGTRSGGKASMLLRRFVIPVVFGATAICHGVAMLCAIPAWISPVVFGATAICHGVAMLWRSLPGSLQ